MALNSLYSLTEQWTLQILFFHSIYFRLYHLVIAPMNMHIWMGGNGNSCRREQEVRCEVEFFILTHSHIHLAEAKWHVQWYVSVCVSFHVKWYILTTNHGCKQRFLRILFSKSGKLSSIYRRKNNNKMTGKEHKHSFQECIR